MQASKSRWENHPGFETQDGLHEVQNRSNQWPHKMNLGPNKNFKKYISWT